MVEEQICHVWYCGLRCWHSSCEPEVAIYDDKKPTEFSGGFTAADRECPLQRLSKAFCREKI